MSVIRVSPEIVTISGELGLCPGVWTKSKARKANRCAFTGVLIRKGDLVYKPITNSNRRMQRIIASALDK